jgi:Zn-dependent peptidase ImmA (M78 family)
MRRGFKEEAKRLALEVRQEIGLDAYGPLDPLLLANEYGVDVYQLSELGNYGCSDAALSYFADDETAAFSAALIPIGTGLVILDNDNHASTRRRSSVAHEMAHVLLEHQFTVAILGPDGCRSVGPEIETEAEWFGGELLITYAAAMMLARRNASDAEVARRYGVSQKRAAMRMNASGARTVVTRQRATRRS